MVELTSQYRVVLTEDTLMQQLDEDAVLLNLETEQYFGLDEVGTRMLQVMLQSPDLGAAYESLLAEYDVTPKRLEMDMTRFLDELLEHGLVRVLPNDAVAG